MAARITVVIAFRRASSECNGECKDGNIIVEHVESSSQEGMAFHWIAKLWFDFVEGCRVGILRVGE
jgi:hypothetical protein